MRALTAALANSGGVDCGVVCTTLRSHSLFLGECTLVCPRVLYGGRGGREAMLSLANNLCAKCDSEKCCVIVTMSAHRLTGTTYGAHSLFLCECTLPGPKNSSTAPENSSTAPQNSSTAPEELVYGAQQLVYGARKLIYGAQKTRLRRPKPRLRRPQTRLRRPKTRRWRPQNSSTAPKNPSTAPKKLIYGARKLCYGTQKSFNPPPPE